MTYLFKAGIASLLSLVLAIGGGGAVSYGQVRVPRGVVVIHLPPTANAHPSEAGVRQYVLRQRYRDSPYYVFTADTTAAPLLEGPTYGIYYTGQGRTDHSPSRYQVVYWFNQDLFWVENLRDLSTQRKILKNWFKAVGLRADKSERQRIQTNVERFVKANQQQVNSDVF
jgi:hypothetical protein